VRPARRADAADLARCVDLASGGLVRRFWAEMAEPGEGVFAVGARRAARDEGAFSWRNAWIAEVGGAAAGGMVGYRIGDAAEPVEEAPPVARPLVALENEALGSWYVNVLATYVPFRGRGVATALLRRAATAAGAADLSLIVADGNQTARRLYERFGFVERARRPIVAEGWETDSRAWVLMLRPAG
jgi:ribosomal protein S18 acetylase RimI-like enzyme